jgi:soluble lytic murein transglycosylase
MSEFAAPENLLTEIPPIQCHDMFGEGTRRNLLGMLAAFSITCHSQVNPPPSQAEQDVESPSASSRLFDPGIVLALPDSPLGQARARFDAGDYAEAQRLALSATGSLDAAGRGELLWIAARAAERQREPARAVQLFAEIPSTHVLFPWARLAAARLSLDTPTDLALQNLASLADSTWSGQSEARALRAIALARAGRPSHEEALREALETANGATRTELERALAELLATRDSEDARAEAVNLFRWIDARSVREGQDARRAAEILRMLSPARRRELAEPSVDQRMAHADALAAAMDHRGAEDAYGAIASSAGDDLARFCEARLGQGRSMYRRRARREAAALLAPLADRCRDHDDIRAWARFYAAKSYSSQNLTAEAIAQYDVLAEELPNHRLADDALILAARLAEGRGDAAGMRTRLLRITSDFPAGDMRGEARFLLAYQARREGHLTGALAHLDAALAEPGEHGEDERGRAAYWRGRVLESLERQAEAATQYESVARSAPLSYYAQQAISRLFEIDEARARAALPTRPDSIPPLVFPHRAELDHPSFNVSLALIRVGELSLAERELSASGLLASDAPPEALWIAAALFDRAGAHTKALELARRRLRDGLLSSAPEGEAFARWRIAYPRAFHPLIETAAHTENVPASFVRAIAREESSFRADAVSVAHAYGLCQIIASTAERIARSRSLESDPQALRRPEINVRIGAAYISALRVRFDPQPALVPAAYNAGEGAVERWLRERGSLPLDEFIEEIPYEETRRYSRRVLQTWGIYAWLDEGELPRWPRDLPRR